MKTTTDADGTESFVQLTPSGLGRADEILDRPTFYGSGRATAGMTVGRCVLKELIGRGGMGEVWKAGDPLIGTDLVVKLLPPELAANPTEVQRLKESFRRVMDLPHQHICPVYQFDLDPRIGPFVVMKYIAGVPLSVYRARFVKKHGRFGVADVVRVLGPIAEALDYAHGKGVIHRDIKPENILVREDGQDPQLVDFGLAAEIQRSVTRTSQVRFDSCGTLAYMAPEQWRGWPQDGATDQYALATVAFELLAGSPPFDLPDAQILRQCVLHDAPRELPGDRDLSAALARGLAKTAAERYANCTELIRAIEHPPKAPPVVPGSATARGEAGRRRPVVPILLTAAAVAAGGAYYFKPPASASSVAAAPTAAPTPAPTIPPPVPVPTPAPATVPPVVPPVVPVANPDAIDAAERDRVLKELNDELERLAAPVKEWRNQLTSLEQPIDAKSADVHKRLLETRTALADFAGVYSETGRTVRSSPPTLRSEIAPLRKKVTDAAAYQINGRTAAKWVESAGDDHGHYEKMLATVKESRKKELANFTDAVRKAGKDLFVAAEAADTHGFDVDNAAVKEVRKTLLERRGAVREAIEALAQIERQVTAALPPDPKRLGELQTQFVGIAIPDADWAATTRLLAAKVEGEAKAARIEFETRRERLGAANLEAQWFICTNQSKEPIFVGNTERKSLTYEGKTPFLHDNKDHVVRFNRGRTSAPYGNFQHLDHGPLPVVFVNEDKQPETLLIQDDQNKDQLGYKYSTICQDSWKFAYKAGTLRQMYVPFNEVNIAAVDAKQAEMQQALADKLNALFPGLNLTTKDVSITWKRVKSGSEKAVTLENMFGRGFQVGVTVPKDAPPNLVGEGDYAYRALVQEAQRLATGVAAAPIAQPALVAGSTWRGTLTVNQNNVPVRVKFTDLDGPFLRGTLTTTDYGRNSDIPFSGAVKGTEFRFVTNANDNGGGVEYVGRINGDTASGKCTGYRNGAASFSITRE